MAGVADHERIESARAAPEESCLGEGQPSGAPRACVPALAYVVPHVYVLLVNFDTGSPQAGDHLRVARVTALIRAEVTESQRCVRAGFRRIESMVVGLDGSTRKARAASEG